MPQPNRLAALGSFGALLLFLGMCSICGAGIQVFGDRMPNPPPDIQAQFEERNRHINWMMAGGFALIFIGAICVAVVKSRKQN